MPALPSANEGAFTIATAEEFLRCSCSTEHPQARRNDSRDIAAPKRSISLALVVNEPKSLHSVQSNDRLGRVVDGHISSLEL